MAHEIHPHATLLERRLTIAQSIQCLFYILETAGTDMESIPQLLLSLEDLRRDAAALDLAYRHSTKMFETHGIAAKDNTRDYLLRTLTSRIASLLNYPQSDAEGEEARRLSFILETYKSADKAEFAAETASVRSLVRDMKQYGPLLTKYGLTGIVDSLEAANEEFSTLYNERNQTRLDIKDMGDLQILRKAAVQSFDNVCKIITGLMLIVTDDASKAALARIVNVININIDQFTVIYNRHAGIVAKHKKGGDKDDTATQTPDPPAQKPDTTLPAAPATPNQQPDTSNPPPEIDPGDPVGE